VLSDISNDIFHYIFELLCSSFWIGDSDTVSSVVKFLEISTLKIAEVKNDQLAKRLKEISQKFLEKIVFSFLKAVISNVYCKPLIQSDFFYTCGNFFIF
jgi:hypothetical protein